MCIDDRMIALFFIMFDISVSIYLFVGSRIDDLEKSISDLMNQAGIEPDATPFDENEEKK